MKVGLALSGGGVKGAAHIGVVKALLENNIPIDAIGGTSAGAIVSALYALGYTPSEMLKLFHYFAKMILKGSPTYLHPSGKKTLSIQVGGILSGESILNAVHEAARYKGKEKIEQLKLPICIPTVEIEEAEKYVFTNQTRERQYDIKDVDIATAVRASCSYPGVFAPCIYQNHKFVDGGILDNVPADEVRNLGMDFVIAVKFALNKKGKTRGIAGVATRAIDIMFDKRSSDEVASADVVLDIDTKSASVFDIKKLNDCYQLGYAQTLVAIEQIRKKRKEKEEQNG